MASGIGVRQEVKGLGDAKRGLQAYLRRLVPSEGELEAVWLLEAETAIRPKELKQVKTVVKAEVIGLYILR